MTVLAALSTTVVVGIVLGRLARRRPSRSKLPQTPGRHFGLEVTRAQFWLTSTAAGLITFGCVLGLTGLFIVAVVPAVVVAFLPRAYYARRKATRLAEIQLAWPDGLRDLLSSVRSGSSLPSALEELGRFGPLPLREVFASFPVYSRSLGVVPALEMIRSDLADPTSDRVIEVLMLAHERGGTVVPQILSDLAVATTRDVWTLEQVRSEALEQKINSKVVFVLPWVVLVVMTIRSGPFRDFYATNVGITVVVICGLLSLGGMAMASKIGAQPEEPRVFVGGRR